MIKMPLVHLDLKQNDFTDLLDIWERWGVTTRANFDKRYGHIARLLKIQIDDQLLKVIVQFWDPSYRGQKTEHRRKLAKMMGVTPREVDQNLRKNGDNECIPWSFRRSCTMKHQDTEQGQLVMA
ncbi:Uncharacterized protein TCM_036295 [Theobroma cacao]|uniref:DUF7745 domain-containing protein n=1 Tax=Theobroma cacao TaxID=3641 RepID=A0A061FIF8_THECC|nr:Uncharacterized protein TCM_036295 [Theobroma cacao]